MSSLSSTSSSPHNYEVREHRLTKQVRRVLTDRGCMVEYRKHLYMDTMIVQEDITLSCVVDLFREE